MSAASMTIEAMIATFQAQKAIAEKAMSQIPDGHMHTALSEDSNSVAVIVKHMSGNLISRFTDFLTADGEKLWRDRDAEFMDDLDPREVVMQRWNAGWACLFGAMARLTDADLARTVFIRSEPHSVALALARALAHQSYHVGQIVQACRVLAQGQPWKTITIPRGGSAAFNARLGHGPSQGPPSASA